MASLKVHRSDWTKKCSAHMEDGPTSLLDSLMAAKFLQKNKEFKDILTRIENDVAAGIPLSVAMSKFPEVFDKEYVTVIRKGEVDGVIDEAFQKLSSQT